jgi:hypothetical protein
VFDRFISIDWSGAGTETDRGDIHPWVIQVENPAQDFYHREGIV